MEYDPEGNLLRETDEEGRTIEYKYDLSSNCIVALIPRGKVFFSSMMLKGN